MHAKGVTRRLVGTTNAVVVTAIANHAEQLALLTLERTTLRRINARHRVGRRSASPDATASTPAAAAGGRRRRCLRTRRADVRQLANESAVERE